MTAFLIGLFIGSTVGLLVGGLCAAAKRGDAAMERER